MNTKKDDIYIRPITIDDTDALLEWRNSCEVKQYFIYQGEITKEDHLNWLKNKVETGKVVQFIIIEEKTETPIGSVYMQDIDHVHKKAEYGILICNSDKTGKGYGTLAAKLMIKYAFEEMKLHKVYLRVIEGNERAIKSYEKAGFIKEALLHDDVYINGVYKNIILMGIVNGEN